MASFRQDGLSSAILTICSREALAPVASRKRAQASARGLFGFSSTQIKTLITHSISIKKKQEDEVTRARSHFRISDLRIKRPIAAIEYHRVQCRFIGSAFGTISIPVAQPWPALAQQQRGADGPRLPPSLSLPFLSLPQSSEALFWPSPDTTTFSSCFLLCAFFFLLLVVAAAAEASHQADRRPERPPLVFFWPSLVPSAAAAAGGGDAGWWVGIRGAAEEFF